MSLDRFVHLSLLAMSNVGAMVLMIILTSCSHAVHRNQKFNFNLIYSVVIGVVLTQYVSRILEGSSAGLRWLLMAVTVFSYLLAPLIPVVLTGVISGLRKAKPLLPLYLIYTVLVLASLRYPLIFAVDENGVCSGGSLYWVYIGVCLIGTVYLIREIMRICSVYQNLSRVTVVILLTFLLSGTAVELFIPGIYTGCSALSFSAVLCYIYFTEQWLQQDGLTGLLNHSTYLRRMEDIPLGSVLILFDVNDFKGVNDNCGHLFGDVCLREIARLIRSVFQSIGYCYRIGGDEFAVLIQKKGVNAQDKCRKFRHFLTEQQKTNPKLPGVALGYAVYQEGMSVEDLINLADQNMYRDKKEEPI